MIREFLTTHYLFLKCLHIIAVVFWMASLFYLPRLFLYHARVDPYSEMSQTFKIMEKRLIRIIMTPALCFTWLFGICLLCVQGMLTPPLGWIHIKIILVLILSGFHGFLVGKMRAFTSNTNIHSEKFYRMINEVPPLIFIFIVFLVVLKPF